MEVLSGNGVSVLSTGQSEYPDPASSQRDEVILVWRSRPADSPAVPAAIIVGDGQLRDFLAWATTYFPSVRPLTAFVRVLEEKTASQLLNHSGEPELGTIGEALVGAILGEALALANTPLSRAGLTPIACFSTYSFCMARALAFKLPCATLPEVGERWSFARRLTDQPPRAVDHQDLGIVWHVADALLGDRMHSPLTQPDRLLVLACEELKKEGTILENTWASVTKGSFELQDAQNRMRGPREDRIRVLTDFAARDCFSHLTSPSARFFALGYLSSLLGPGSLAHAEVVAPLFSKLPAAYAWYGFCAGLHKKTEVLSAFGVLGRRVLREILRSEDLLSTPSADVSLPELQIILETDLDRVDFRTVSSNYMCIEISPLVSTYLSIHKKDGGRQSDLFAHSVSSPETFARLGKVIDQAADLYRRIASVTPTIEGRNQRSSTALPKKGPRGKLRP
jgi:hypothetical protein